MKITFVPRPVQNISLGDIPHNTTFTAQYMGGEDVSEALLYRAAGVCVDLSSGATWMDLSIFVRGYAERDVRLLVT